MSVRRTTAHKGHASVQIRTAKPDALLAAFIDAYVQREYDVNGTELVEPVVARLGTMLEFQFAGPYDVPAYGVDKPNPSVPITIIGPITSCRVRILIRGCVEALVILFRPIGFYRLFQTPVSFLAGTGTEGHSVLGSSISALYQRLGNVFDFDKRVEVLNSFFVQRLTHTTALVSAGKALRMLMTAGSSVSVAVAAQHAGLSIRQLERKSLEYVGAAAKLLTRIARFQRALRLKTRSSINWTEVAHGLVYHDQMHMIHDFRDFAGNAPGRVMRDIADHHLITFFDP